MVNQPLRWQVSDCEAVRLAGGRLAYLLPSAGREIDHPQSSPHHKSPQFRMASIRTFGGCHSIQLSYERVDLTFYGSYGAVANRREGRAWGED